MILNVWLKAKGKNCKQWHAKENNVDTVVAAVSQNWKQTTSESASVGAPKHIEVFVRVLIHSGHFDVEQVKLAQLDCFS